MFPIWAKSGSKVRLLSDLGSEAYLQRFAKAIPGKIQYTCFPNEEGGIVDDLLVYCYEDEKYLLVVNASNIEKDYSGSWTIIRQGAVVENASEKISQLAVQGPNATGIVAKAYRN